MPKNQNPPRWTDRLLENFCAPHLLEEVQGDLQELYGEWRWEYGEQRANWLYLWHTIKFFRPFVIRRNHTIRPLNQSAMFKNYFKVGVRNILKYRVFSFINVFGLAVAMSVCMLIILMLADQRSYDQFHTKKDQIYRVLSHAKGSAVPNATSPFPLAATLPEYTTVEEATHLVPGAGGDATYGERSVEVRGFFADSSFFNVFSFDLVEGDKREALSQPNAMVITRERAEALFGNEEAIGKRVEFANRGLRLLKFDFVSDPGTNPVDWGSFTITGVIDLTQYKSHIKFDMLISAASLPALHHQEKVTDLTNNWRHYSQCYTYALLKPESNEVDLTTLLNTLVADKYADFEELAGLKLVPQSLDNIAVGQFAGNPLSLRLPIEAYYFLGFLALIILLSAGLNYTNLSVARALTRAKEIGVRKVTGAKRRDVIYQFLSESVLTVLFALGLAYLLLTLVKSAFMGLWANQYLDFDLQGDALVYFAFLGLAILIGLLAGAYPALHLSRYTPVRVLKNLSSEKPGKLGVRKMLSVSQFVISLFFIVTSLLVYHQFRHYLDFEYGFDSENLVNIPLQGNDYQQLYRELSSVPEVSTISASAYIPATAMSLGSTRVRKAGNEPNEADPAFERMSVDTSFISNLGLRLVAGRNLRDEGDSNRKIVVNEAAVQALGYEYPSDILGELLEIGAYEESMEVVGVLEDFKFQTPVMEDGIGPLLFRYQPEQFSYLNVKIAAGDVAGTLAKLSAAWQRVDPVHPFQYQFFDDQLVKVNQWLGDLVAIIGFIAALAIIIACLGLLGMATYTAERRTKEVGIRKVLGAGEFNLALLLSRGFLTTLAVSVALGAPLSYFINNLWLQNFPNRVDFGVAMISGGSLVLLVLGLLTIGSQTLRVAQRNPVDTLRNE
ncbi:MAG: ABC transporter permease [Bacteroidota bacterium]